MTIDPKLLERLRRRPPEVDFGDVRRLLEQAGWTVARQKGSHVSFTKVGGPTITVPLVGGRRVRGVYIDKVLDLIGLVE